MGRVGISMTDGESVCLSVQQKFQTLSGTVASFRIDAITAFVTHLSREKATQLIRQGRFKRYHTTIKTPSVLLQAGDVFSLQGYGKFRLDEVDGMTRKGRHHITILKYQ